MASYLLRNSPTPTSEKKFTFSTWLKLSSTSTAADNGIVEWYKTSSERFQVLIDSATRQLRVYAVESGVVKITIYSDMVFRDPSAWYNICIHQDTTQASASDRLKLWVNGVAQTFSSYTYNFSQNVNINVFDGSGTKLNLGTRGEAYATWLNGLLADTYYIDGSLIAYTEFGELDSTSSIWKPNTQPTISSFGNAGFHLKYEDSSNIGLDSSGNTNNFSTSGTLTQNVDTPSNNFATINPLYYSTSQSTLSNGNLTATSSGANWNNFHSTLAPSTGKYYWEVKVVNVGSNTHPIGIVGTEASDINSTSPGDSFDGDATGISYVQTGDKDVAGSRTSYGNSYTTGDIIGVAMDLDNLKLYFHKNGVYQNSGVPTSGATGTGAISIVSGHSYLASFAHYNTMVDSINFGQGYFGTTAVASAGTSPSGGGIFEYDCPSGYQALCTKGINSF